MKNRSLLLLFIGIAAIMCWSNVTAIGQTNPEFKLRSGQAVYIVAFRDSYQVVVSETSGNTPPTPAKEHYLDLEKKVDEQLRKWGYFRIVDRPSDADFILLVYIDMSSIEGLAVSADAYRNHYRDRFDLDQLRDMSYVRATAGPLNLSTLSRLTARMIKQMREKVEGAAQ